MSFLTQHANLPSSIISSPSMVLSFVEVFTLLRSTGAPETVGLAVPCWGKLWNHVYQALLPCSHQSVHQMCHTNVSYKCVIQMCRTNVSYKCVHQMCHTNVSYKCVIKKKKNNVLFESRTEFHSTEGAASVEQLKEKTWWITDHMRRSHVTWVGFCHLWR